MATGIGEALARALAPSSRAVREGPLAALAEAYAREIDGSTDPDVRREALKDFGPKLQSALTALGVVPVTRVTPGVSGGESGEESEGAPAALSADELASRRQADALARLRVRAKDRGA